MKVAFAALLAVAACERSETATPPPPPAPPLELFLELDRTARPSDEELVRAAIGNGGTPAERAEVERIAREVLLPVFHAKGPDRIREAYEDCRESYADARRPDPVAAFAIGAAECWVIRFHWASNALAHAWVHRELWSDEPIEREDAAAIDPSTIEKRANEMWRTYFRLQELVRPRAPEIFDIVDRIPEDRPGFIAQAMFWALEDDLRIASGGGWGRSNGIVHVELVAHKRGSTPTPGF